MSILYLNDLKNVFEKFIGFKRDVDSKIDDLKRLDIFLQLTDTDIEKNNKLDFENNLEIKNLKFKYPNISKIELDYLQIVEDRINKIKNK